MKRSQVNVVKQKVKKGIVRAVIFLVLISVLYFILHWIVEDLLKIGPVLQITHIACLVIMSLISLIVTILLTRGSKSKH